MSFNVGTAPKSPVERAVKPAGKRSYNAGSIDRLKSDWTTTTTSADVEVRNDVTKVRARSRQLQRDDPYARRYFRLFANNVLGWQGIKLQMKIKDAAGNLNSSANSQIENAWRKWGRKKNCTIDKRLSWRQVCRLALTSRKRDGGFLIRYVPYFNNEFSFALQCIEVDHLDVYQNVPNYQGSGNEIRMGVELNANKEVVAYHLWTKHPGDYNAGSGFKLIRVPAEEILHLYLPERAHQTMGMPEIAASMSRMNMLNGYEEAEVTAARVAACKGGYITKKAPEEFVGDENDTAGNKVEEMEPGVVRELDPGEDFVEHDPKHPNTAYGPFTKTVLRGVASGMMISYNALANDLEGVNYSSIRAGVLEDREEFMMEQEDFIEDLCEPIFERWLKFALLSGQVALPVKQLQQYIDGATWQGRRWSWVDPLKDINAAVVAIENRLESRTGVVSDRGGDFETLLDEIEEEERQAEEKGVSLPEVTPPMAQIEPEEDGDEPPPKAAKKRFSFRSLMGV